MIKSTDKINAVFTLVVLPAIDHRYSHLGHSSLASIMLRSLCKQAKAITGSTVYPAAYNASDRRLFYLDTGCPVDLHDLCLNMFPSAIPEHRVTNNLKRSLKKAIGINQPQPDIVAFLGAGFLLDHSGRFSDMIRLSEQSGLAYCALPGRADIHAFAVRLPLANQAEQRLHDLLHRLTCTIKNPADPAPLDLPENLRLNPFLNGPCQSPAMAGISSLHAPSQYDSPNYLNTALTEVCSESFSGSNIEGDPVRLAETLDQLRARSLVPWIFNELLCDVEYRTAVSAPRSLPPELHLSLASLCNLQCRFCSYDHAQAKSSMIMEKDMLQHMDSFHWIRTLRLQSGNGEPTTNPHLASIISLLARSEPHLDLSFYTNGVLLDRNNLIPTLIDNAVGWINVSINAATREQWSELCGADHFLSVCSNLKNLLASKKQRRSYSPLVYGSIVLTCQSASELPRMLELCRELGVDRLTAIPFYAPGYKRPDHYDIEDAYHYIGIDYNRIYYQTIRTAEDYRISIELPLPQVNKSAAFGVEKRILHDFAKIEQNGRRLSTLLSDFIYPTPDMQQCPSLWRLAAITNTTRGHKAADQTHFLYPCLGALCSVDFSEHLPFRFDGDSNLRSLWLHPLLQYLRESQIHQGACAVCDMCRSRDSRDPQSFQQMSDLIKQFCIEHGI